MATLFNFTGTKNTPAVGIDQNGDDQLWMIGMLPDHTVLAFYTGGVKAVEYLAIDVAVMLITEQVEDIAGKHQMLVEFSRMFFENRFHEEAGTC